MFTLLHPHSKIPNLRYMTDWREKGAGIIGGCCGTTPSYIKALSETLQQKEAA